MKLMRHPIISMAAKVFHNAANALVEVPLVFNYFIYFIAMGFLR